MMDGRVVGHREIHVIDTDYERYAILRLSLHWQGKAFHVLKYFTPSAPVSPPQPAAPTARSLEDRDEPGFWRFRELTADTGLYLVARHGRCAELLKEVSVRLAALPAEAPPHRTRRRQTRASRVVTTECRRDLEAGCRAGWLRGVGGEGAGPGSPFPCSRRQGCWTLTSGLEGRCGTVSGPHVPPSPSATRGPLGLNTAPRWGCQLLCRQRNGWALLDPPAAGTPSPPRGPARCPGALGAGRPEPPSVSQELI
ncbi:hypothetical protein QTO34_004919 [Cnephaeus nilssonii]|uniref:Lipocalin/cytosolic fatty-acid binding domain-containing protein n=1 Tax=Cnephaeus nilssonii TaxID=3371016 RepID=A0AA40HNM2_CNENI|nr:hypothetical protein QTO34_004919 [Eptesicus nilssonii]